MSHRGAAISTVLLAAGVAYLVHPIANDPHFEIVLWGERVTLTHPRFLYALSLLPFVAFAARFSLADLPRPQRYVGVVLRGLLLASLVAALSRPATTVDSTKVSTVFLVDVSDSMPDEALAEAQERLATAWEARGENDLQVVTFAKEARAIPAPDGSEEPPPIRRHEDGSATDPAAALRLAYGLFPPGHLRRVVLVSDGGQTHGDLLSEAAHAAEFGVRLDHLPSDHGAPPEIGVLDLDVPERIRVGEPFEVRATIFSTRESQARARLYQGETLNGLDAIRDLSLSPGENVIEFRSVVRVAGPVTYRVTVDEAEGVADTFSANDHYETTVVVPGRPAILYVEGARGRGSYLARALTAAGFEVDVRSPRGIPTSLRELQRFDFFILSDVPKEQVSMAQVDAIDRYVRQLGGGFLMAGGEQSFGLGGWQGSRMERMLPVRLDAERRRDQPSLALALVIDRSGSMSGQKIQLAKEAAKATAGLLSADDYITVIGFDSRPQRIVRMQSAANRYQIERDISRLAARGGTAIFPALDMAYQDLSVTRARIKHVILLTDGQAPEQGIPELVQVMRAEGITVSSVGLGADVNRGLLQSVANLGGGRSYFTNDPHNIPRIFMRETNTVARSAAVEEYFRPRVTSPADFLRGVPIEAAPFLHGYVATRPKPPPAQVVLESELGEPILARWRLGLGWSMAWTSDVKNRWAVEWLRWPAFSRFWAQLVREHMRERRGHRLDMRAEILGDDVRVRVDGIGRNDEFLNGLDSTLTVRGPMGAPRRAPEDDPDAIIRRERQLPLRQVAPGLYEARFPLEGYGSFVLEATHRRDGRKVAESSAQLARPYPREYRDLGGDLSILRSASQITGGGAGAEPAALFDPGEESIRSLEELWPRFLYAALVLYLLDLVLRRVRLSRVAPRRAMA